MSIIAAALKHMLAAGMPHDAIIAAVADMEAIELQANEDLRASRRANNAERQRRFRARHREDSNACNGSNALPALPPPDDPQHLIPNVEVNLTPPVPSPKKDPKGSQKGPLPCPKKPEDWPQDYQAQVWEAYGKKVDKKASIAALDRMAATTRLPWHHLMAAIKQQSETTAVQYRPSLERWIKRERWEDAPPTTNGSVKPHVYYCP